jgi:tetratricopeptide (TPR) repeat protein
MNTLLTHAFLLSLCLSVYNVRGKPFDSKENPQADSLIQLLSKTKQIEEQIKLRSLIADELLIERIPYWDSILSDSRKYHLPIYESKSLKRIGRIYHLSGNAEKAEEAYTASLKVAEANGYKTEIIDLIKRLVILYSQQSDGRKSVSMAYKGLRIAEEINDKKAAIDFYSSIALYYWAAGEIQKALNIHLRCLKISREIGYEFGIASALVDIGTDYIDLHQTEKGIPYYLESRKYINAVTEPGYVLQIYASVSSAFQFMNQPDSAYYYAYKAYTMAKQLNDKMALSSAMAMLTRIYHISGDHRNAKKLGLETLELAKELKYKPQIRDICINLKAIYLREENYKEALKVYELYIAARDSLSDEEVSKQAIEKEFSYNLEKKENEYRILAQQNEIQTLQLRQNHSILWWLGSLLVVILIVAWLLVRQGKLRNAHQHILSEQKLLRSQMNPHFVFNSLNSIQHLVISSQNNRAELYLSKFSKLIRGLLENSIKENLTLKEEIDILNAYLEMESLRFGSTFSYSIKVDNRIDPLRTNIPPFMIQPFIENAIWHGLLAKDDDRILKITIDYDSEKTIKCIVDDNGVGREASAQKADIFSKQSLGISFVKQRIELIRETYNVSGKINLLDKKDVYNNSLGTTVIIILPLIP